MDASRKRRLRTAGGLVALAGVAVVATIAAPEDPPPQGAQANELVENDFVERFQRGQRLLGRGADEEAEKLFRQLAAERPEQASVHHALGLLLQFRRRPAEATTELLAAAKLAPDDAVIRRDAGLQILAMGRAADAQPHLAAASRLWPQDVESAVGHGAALRALGRTAEAEAEYRRAVAADGNSVDAATGLAACVVAANPAEALKLVEKATGQWPDVLLVRGMALQGLGREVEAVAQLVQVARVAPAGPAGTPFVRGAAEALAASGDAINALPLALRWLEGEPSDDARVFVAMVREATGDHDAAIAVLAETTSDRAALVRGALLVRAGRWNEARDAWTSVGGGFEAAAASRLLGKTSAEDFAKLAKDGLANDVAWVESVAADLAGDAAAATKLRAKTVELSRPRGEFPGLLVR